MPIVNTIRELDGRHMVERHVDHLGNEYMQSWFVPEGFTQAQIDAKVTAHAADLEESLAAAELMQVIG